MGEGAYSPYTQPYNPVQGVQAQVFMVLKGTYSATIPLVFNPHMPQFITGQPTATLVSPCALNQVGVCSSDGSKGSGCPITPCMCHIIYELSNSRQ